MAAIKAIPRSVLIHSVVYKKEETADRWGEKAEKEKFELSFVRMEPSRRIVRDKNNAEIQLSAALFYDCRNSRPRGMEFAVDDVIIFNGQKHRVQLVEPLYDGERLHHYELGLIKYA